MSIDVRAINWSGAVPVGKTNTAPSERESTNDPSPPRHLSALGRDGFTATEPDVSPPRPSHARERATDLMKATVPMPFMLTLIGLVVSIVIGVLSIKSDVRLIDERLNHEKELRLETDRRRDEQFKALESKIEAAGLRNSAMLLSQELQKAQETTKGR